jgi:YfiH family protein
VLRHFDRGGYGLTRNQLDSLPIWQFDHLSALGGLRHGVTTRRGGVSEAPYAELNLGLHVSDDLGRVVENRRRVCRALGVEFERCTFAQQVHGTAIRLVEASDAGAGRASFDEGLAGADGLVVRQPGITVAVLVADCLPLVLYDAERHVGAVVHAGWRGTAAGIAACAVKLLVDACESEPSALLAGLGPAIGRCCYEVGPEVVEGLARGFHYQAPVAEERGGRWYADMGEANRQQLVAAGVRSANIELSGVCSACDSDEFYSERKLGRPTGRFGVFLSLG